MNYFMKLGEVDVAELNNQLASYSPWQPAGKWPYLDVSAPANSAQHICLRAWTEKHPHEMVPYPAWWKLPAARPIVFELMKTVQGVFLGMVHISRLAPGGVIVPHQDHCGEYSENVWNYRYHIPLSGTSGMLFRCEDEEVEMLTGEVWTFSHRNTHSVENRTDLPRIHLMIDITLSPRRED
jgi:hypothetical protein